MRIVDRAWDNDCPAAAEQDSDINSARSYTVMCEEIKSSLQMLNAFLWTVANTLMPDARGKEGSAGSRRGEQWCYLLPKTEGGNDYQVGGMSCYWLSVTTGGNIFWIEMEIFLVNLWSTDGSPEHGPWAALWCNKKDKFVWVGHCISDLLKGDTTWASRGTACSRDQGQNFR